MVAGAGGNYTMFALIGTKGEKLIEGSAFLERASHLQVIKLKKDSCACHTAYRLRVNAGGIINCRGNAGASGLDVSKYYHNLLFVHEPGRTANIREVTVSNQQSDFNFG